MTQRLFPPPARVVRSKDCDKAESRQLLLLPHSARYARGSTDMGIFKLTFPTGKKLHSEIKQNKMEEEISLSTWLETWGFGTYQNEFANPQEESRGCGGAKTVLNPASYSHLRPLLPGKEQSDPAC